MNSALKRELFSKVVYGPKIRVRIKEPDDFYNAIKKNNKLVKNRLSTERNVNYLTFNPRNSKNVQNFFKIYARVKKIPIVKGPFLEELPYMKQAGIYSNKATKIARTYRNIFRVPLPNTLNTKVKSHPMAKRILLRKFEKAKFENVLKQIKKVSTNSPSPKRSPNSRPNIPNNMRWTTFPTGRREAYNNGIMYTYFPNRKLLRIKNKKGISKNFKNM